MVKPMLSLSNVTYKVQQIHSIDMTSTWQTLLTDINLSIYKGDILGIVGPNGTGKSTLCQLIAGILVPTEGQLLLNQIDYQSIEPHWQIHQDIGILFQNIDEQFIGRHCLEDTLIYLSNFHFSNEDIISRLLQSSSILGVTDLIERPFRYLSGGQKQLLALAEILALQPKVIILDEPTAQLDPYNERLVIDALKKIVQQTDTTLIIVSHKLVELQLSQKILGLTKGKIAGLFDTQDCLTNPFLLKKFSLPTPSVVDLSSRLLQAGLPISPPKTIDPATFISTVTGLYREKED